MRTQLFVAVFMVLPTATRAQHGPTADTTRMAFSSRPTVVRGLYVSRWAALSRRVWDLIEVARRTEINALVLDVKDDRGYLLYRSGVPLAHRIGADTTQPLRLERLRALLDAMRANGIHPIARIVVAKDPILAAYKREWAVRRRSDGNPWLDKLGNPWLDPHQKGVWAYASEIAKEAVELGFRDVQFDYVRFPDDRRLLREAVFSLAHERTREQVIREQLGALHTRLAALGIPMAIDVFGFTTSDTTDMGIGQHWEHFIDQAEIVLPMAYPSHYSKGMYDIPQPNAHPYEVISCALSEAQARSKSIAHAAEIVPWYQDFTLGPPRYGVKEIREQIQAGYDRGVRSWILWNPASKYTIAALRPAILAEAEPAPARAEPTAADCTPVSRRSKSKSPRGADRSSPYRASNALTASATARGASSGVK